MNMRFELCYFYKGGLSYTEVKNMTTPELLDAIDTLNSISIEMSKT